MSIRLESERQTIEINIVMALILGREKHQDIKDEE
jgi:hypothetical protein